MGLKQRIPWWGKIGAKLVLSRLPMGYALWQRLGLFRHGSMDEAAYALSVFDEHIARLGLSGRLVGKTILEVGPGDSIATAIIARAHGARAILLDVGPFAKPQPAAYDALAKALRERGLHPPAMRGLETLDEVLAACDGRYLTNGLESLRTLPPTSVDVIYSQAALEHVRKREFLDVQRELCRVLKDDGVCSHRVDLKDHLDSSLNNLRFGERLWESDFFASSGFYTNRINFEAMVAAFREADFDVEIAGVQRWPELPIPRHRLASEFRSLNDDVLRVSGFNVVLRRANPTAPDRPVRAGP